MEEFEKVGGTKAENEGEKSLVEEGERVQSGMSKRWFVLLAILIAILVAFYFVIDFESRHVFICACSPVEVENMIV